MTFFHWAVWTQAAGCTSGKNQTYQERHASECCHGLEDFHAGLPFQGAFCVCVCVFFLSLFFFQKYIFHSTERVTEHVPVFSNVFVIPKAIPSRSSSVLSLPKTNDNCSSVLHPTTSTMNCRNSEAALSRRVGALEGMCDDIRRSSSDKFERLQERLDTLEAEQRRTNHAVETNHQSLISRISSCELFEGCEKRSDTLTRHLNSVFLLIATSFLFQAEPTTRSTVPRGRLTMRTKVQCH